MEAPIQHASTLCPLVLIGDIGKLTSGLARAHGGRASVNTPTSQRGFHKRRDNGGGHHGEFDTGFVQTIARYPFVSLTGLATHQAHARTRTSIYHLDSPVSNERCILNSICFLSLHYNCQQLIKHVFFKEVMFLPHNFVSIGSRLMSTNQPLNLL